MTVMVEDSIHKVRHWLTLPRCRKAKLAREASVHVNSLSNIEDETWNPTVATLRALCAAVDRLTPPGAA
jgi:DNA-binding XRE family transcriptional regulator